MNGYINLSKKLAKKQIIEKITLELVYEFLILDNKEMDIVKVEDLNVVNFDDYLKLVDESLDKLNQKLSVKIVRKSNKLYMGNCNK